MTWTYSGNPASSTLDAARFWVQDTDTNRQLLSNEEINYLIGVGTGLWGEPLGLAVAAVAADVIVGKLAAEVDISADGVSISVAALSDKYQKLADHLRETYGRIAGAGAEPLAFGIDAISVPDFGVRPPSFGKGFMDNPRAGNQEWGWNANGAPQEVPDSGYWTGP